MPPLISSQAPPLMEDIALIESKVKPETDLTADASRSVLELGIGVVIMLVHHFIVTDKNK